MTQTGLDLIFDHQSVLKGKRVALLAHPASIDSRLRHILDLFLQKKIRLTKLFGPEHGIYGEAQDMDSVESSVDPKTNLPVKSLYGPTFESLTPTSDDLRDVDI